MLAKETLVRCSKCGAGAYGDWASLYSEVGVYVYKVSCSQCSNYLQKNLVCRGGNALIGATFLSVLPVGYDWNVANCPDAHTYVSRYV